MVLLAAACVRRCSFLQSLIECPHCFPECFISRPPTRQVLVAQWEEHANRVAYSEGIRAVSNPATVAPVIDQVEHYSFECSGLRYGHDLPSSSKSNSTAWTTSHTTAFWPFHARCELHSSGVSAAFSSRFTSKR